MTYSPATDGLVPGLPHCLTQDDVHAGYFLPKGTVVITNIWYALAVSLLSVADRLSNRSMLRDPRRYTRPENFNPDRFVPYEGVEPEYDPRQIVFGFGRR